MFAITLAEDETVNMAQLASEADVERLWMAMRGRL
jgi:hypothetical protein